jgi:superfamily I DNA/RNA helicase
MARKKKEVEKQEFIPSKYQKAIYDYIVHESGNLVVEAAAGSGKTTTLLKCLELIPNDKQVLLCAFNNDITKELEKRTRGFENVDVRTLHSLGLTMLKRNYPNINSVPDPLKYDSHIKNNLKYYTSIDTRRLTGRRYFHYVDNIKKYVDYGRYYLC